MKKKFPLTLFFLSSFIVPIVVLLIIFKNCGFYPFGEKTLLIWDMKNQYLEFYSSLRYIGKENSIFYSWSRSLGGNYFGLFAYYISSPFALLTLLFPIKLLPAAIVIITLLKIGSAGLTFSALGLYLWKKYTPAQSALPAPIACNWCVFIILPLSVSYALISYNLMYSQCLMWLDGVIMLPMVLLGVEKILDGKRGLHYFLSLILLFWSNYYTGYMVGIFTAIYVFFRISSCINRTNIKTLLMCFFRIAICTLLALGLSAPLLISVLKDITSGKGTSIYLPDYETNFSLIHLLGKFKNGAYDTLGNSGLPSIYCGYLILILAILFFLFPRFINLREKISALLVLLFLISSFYFTKLDIVWHCFHYPNSFPYRYAFVFSFFLIYLGLRYILALANKFMYRNYSTHLSCNGQRFIVTAISCISLTTCIVSLDLYYNGKSIFSGLSNEFGYSQISFYNASIEKTQPLISNVLSKDNGLYRINQYYEYSKNDAMLFGYNGITHYSSTYNNSVNGLTDSLGLAQYWIWNSGYGSTPLVDSLLGVKYILSDNMVPSSYTFLESSQYGSSLYENPYALSFVFGCNPSDLNPDLSSIDPFINQNNLLNSLVSNHYSYFTSCDFSATQLDNELVYNFTANSNNPTYLYIKTPNLCGADVYVNDTLVGHYFTVETRCNLYLGSFYPGQDIVVRIVPFGSPSVEYASIAQLDINLLNRTLEKLSSNNMSIINHHNGSFSGTLHLDQQQMVVSSIPLDSGWMILLDGTEINPVSFADTFIAFPASEGDHTLTFLYTSPGFMAGLKIAIVCFLLTALYFVIFPQITCKKEMSLDPSPDRKSS